MDKKSFIRGFGIGVLFAAIILGISFTVRTSDTFIKARAKELGMVYKGTGGEQPLLALASPEASPKETPKKKDTDKKKTEATPSVAPKATPKPTPKATPKSTPKATAAAATPAPTATPKATAKPKPSPVKKIQTLVIDVGDWSSDVSEKLAAMGIVKNAKDFDKYLNDHGYSSTISAGTYKVSVNDTYEQLARKITRR